MRSNWTLAAIASVALTATGCDPGADDRPEPRQQPPQGDSGGNSPACASCTEGLIACDGDRVSECAFVEGCLRETTYDNCVSTQQCREGQCVPSACSDGSVLPCEDRGICQSGQRTCTGGSYTACDWQIGPGAENCDGLDNNCDGAVDNLPGALCPLQVGVCAGARQRCSAASLNMVCDSTTYGDHAAQNGVTFQMTGIAFTRYATRETTGWVEQLPEDGFWKCSVTTELKIDANDQPHIVCRNPVSGDYVTPDGLGGWTFEEIAPNRAECISLALDSHGMPHVLIHDNLQTVLYAERTTGSWVTETVPVTSSNDRDGCLAIAVDSLNQPHAWLHADAAAGMDDSVYTVRDGAGWSASTIETSTSAMTSTSIFALMVLDGQDVPHIVYRFYDAASDPNISERHARLTP